MPSSTSSSDQPAALQTPETDEYIPPQGTAAQMRAARVATICLLAAMAFVLIATEFAARYIYPRVSHIQGRIVNDQRQAETLANRQESDPPSVLLVGNSLLLHGLDYPKLQSELEPKVRAVRYVIENTEYLDWYYGLRRLFAEGIRPTRVVLVLNLGQTLGHGVLTSSARQLFSAKDLLAVSRDAGLDTTETSSLVFSHWSAFYAGREGIRNYILNVTDPPYAKELNRLARVPPKLPSDEEMVAASRVRLTQLNELCRNNGAQFMFVLAPALSNSNDLLLKAGALEGVDVDSPLPSLSLGPEFYMDRYHLNEKGAAIFTEALAHDLRARFGLH